MKRRQQPRQPDDPRREQLYGLLKQWGAEIEFAASMSKANQLRDWAFGACRYALEMGVIGGDEERAIDKTLEGAYLRAAKRIAAQRADERGAA